MTRSINEGKGLDGCDCWGLGVRVFISLDQHKEIGPRGAKRGSEVFCGANLLVRASALESEVHLDAGGAFRHGQRQNRRRGNHVPARKRAKADGRVRASFVVVGSFAGGCLGIRGGRTAVHPELLLNVVEGLHRAPEQDHGLRLRRHLLGKKTAAPRESSATLAHTNL